MVISVKVFSVAFLVAVAGLILAPIDMAHAAPSARPKNSISDLPILSTVLVDHYDCRADIVLDDAQGSFKEMTFTVDPNITGQEGPGVTINLLNETLVASANRQMLQLTWTRSGQQVASAQTMIQNSSTQSYVLIVLDPKDNSAQVQMGCDAVTYADLKKTADNKTDKAAGK